MTCGGEGPAQYSARRSRDCGATASPFLSPHRVHVPARGSGKIPGPGVVWIAIRRLFYSQLGGVFVTYTDQVITCSDCGIDFVFSASEQEFFAEKGFASAPKRCSSCRAQRRASGGGAGASSYGNGGGYGGGYSRGPREMHDAVCARCGNDTQVPFRPTGARPVYCSDCFRMMRG
jgi:CxxC-x17-CxxC domain-containing protein